MSGNKIIFIIIILFFQVTLIHAGGRIPAQDFRFGLDIQSGIKLLDPMGFHGKGGLLFNKFSIIPYVGTYPDEYSEEEYYGNDDYSTETYTTEGLDVGVTFRFEYPAEIIHKSTFYEYDIEEQKFLHHYYYSPFRPYFQFHVGSFLGIGGGFLYYFTGAVGLGLNVDAGYNLAVENGLGIIPKVNITTAF